jgi:hypothetical protein
MGLIKFVAWRMKDAPNLLWTGAARTPTNANELAEQLIKIKRHAKIQNEKVRGRMS